MKVLVDKEFLEGGLELICDSIRLKTGGTGVLAFPVEMKAAVDSISGSGGITPTGTKEIGENGTYDVTSFASAVVDVPTGIDTSDANAVAADIANGKTAYVDGVKVTGTQPERAASDLTAAGAQVTVPAGLYREQASKSVATATQATPSVSVDSETGVVTATANQSAGYVPDGSKSATLQLTTKAAQTYTPGTTDQTIPAGRYTTGVQTIKGDARLVAGNIKKNVSIFGVTGSFDGGNLEIRGGYELSDYGTAAAKRITLTYPSGVSNVKGIILMPGGVHEFTYQEIAAFVGFEGSNNCADISGELAFEKGGASVSFTSSGCTIDYTAAYRNFSANASDYLFLLITA